MSLYLYPLLMLYVCFLVLFLLDALLIIYSSCKSYSANLIPEIIQRVQGLSSLCERKTLCLMSLCEI